jgi:hypothetical protein
MSWGFLVLLSIFCAIFLGPIIGALGLNRSHQQEAKVTREQWELRIHHLLGYVGMVGGSIGILYLLYSLDRRSGTLGLLLMVGGFPILIVLLALLSKLFPTQKGKNGYYLVLCAIFSVSVLTFFANRHVDLDRVAHSEDLIAQMAAIDRQAMREWIDDIHAAGVHGEPGAVPPMLDVHDTGDAVQVTNLSSQPVCLSIRRHTGNRNQYDNCTLSGPRREAECSWLTAGSRASFELPDFSGRQDCLGAPLSFRVGTRSQAEVVWWSDPEVEALEEQIRNPTAHYGSTGRFTPEEALASYRSMLRQGDRASLWRAMQDRTYPAVAADDPEPEEQQGVAVTISPELSAAHRRVSELERLRDQLGPSARNLPDYLKVSSDWKGEVVLANASYLPQRVRLMRLGRDARGIAFLCAMHGDGDDPKGTAIPKMDTATFRLAADSPCPADKRLPLQVEVLDPAGTLIWMSPELVAIRLAQARDEVSVLQAAPSSLAP